jgi:hypothetical protein
MIRSSWLGSPTPTLQIPVLLAACALVIPGQASGAETRKLNVHLAQANNESPYAFVRARFNPGEVSDPWAVRFFDDEGKEVPYFVWDSITYWVAREGRADWGKRYALINHAPGTAPEVIEARGRKLEAMKKAMPELAIEIEAQEQAAHKAPDSICAAMYLLRYKVPALGKQRLTLRIYPERQIDLKVRRHKAEKVTEGSRIFVKQRELSFLFLPDRLSVVWKGKEVFRSAGFAAGGVAEAVSHVDPKRPFTLESAEGIITKIAVTGQTRGRKEGSTDWQCTYWLFPEGGFVALEGFSLSDPAAYMGGLQKLSIFQTDGNFTQIRAPVWDTPWWLHRSGERGFVATHLFSATPLTIGFGNNPFTVNAEGPNKDPKAHVEDGKLALTWFHRIDDPAITRLMTPQPMRRPGDPKPPAPKPEVWRPGIDWLYRQYVLGVSEKAATAEAALRDVLGAAAGWIDRPITQEDVAIRMIAMMARMSNRQTSEIGLLKIVPALIADDQAAVKEALRRTRDQVERTNFYIDLITDWVARGGRPSAGGKLDPDGTRREGWTGNACYHAALMPCYVRVLEHFEVPFRQKEYRDAILRFADFTLEILSTNPPKASREGERQEKIDFDRLNETFRTEWPSRVVPVIPLVLHAYSLKPDQKYLRAAKILFDDLMRLVERNPHGYWPTWNWNPRADKFDTVYNPVGYERGITALWSEGQLEKVGRQRASRFVAAQARWFVFSGQLLDTLEIDNPTSIRACTHGGHTGIRNQIGIYLYDDFEFYRGLLGDLVTWSAAASQVPGQPDAWGVGAYRSLELSNAGSSMLRWALDIRPGSKWLESKVARLEMNGFRLQTWNRLPHARPTVKVTAKEIGLKGDADAIRVQQDGAAYRLPAEFTLSLPADKVVLHVSKTAKIRLDYGMLRPEWVGKERPVLRRRLAGGAAENVREDVVWSSNTAEWQATSGEYELRIVGK